MSVVTLPHYPAAQSPGDAERIAVIGGGLLGMVLAYRLSRAGKSVELFEAANEIGGVMRTVPMNGYRVDRFYHTILSSDDTLLELIQDVGLGDQTFFNETLNGFYAGGRTYPINSALDLLRFEPLSLYERVRLGIGSQICRMHHDWRRLDAISVRDYLVRYCGRGAYEKFWTHLLRTKYDGSFDELPATAIWARIRRMSGSQHASGTPARTATSQSARKKLGWDLLGYLKGGYQTLIDRLAERIKEEGGKIHTGCPVRRVEAREGRVQRIVVPDGPVRVDRVISTVAYPLLARILPDECAALRKRLQAHRYMGSICILLVMKRQLTPYHTLYLLDRHLPFTGIVETTHYIEPAEVGGRHLVYLSKYFSPDSPLAEMDENEVRPRFLRKFFEMFPDVRVSDIEEVRFSRARYVDPVRRIGQAETIPTATRSGVQGLLVANNAQIYPRLPSGEAVVQFAEEVLEEIGITSLADSGC